MLMHFGKRLVVAALVGAFATVVSLALECKRNAVWDEALVDHEQTYYIGEDGRKVMTSLARDPLEIIAERADEVFAVSRRYSLYSQIVQKAGVIVTLWIVFFGFPSTEKRTSEEITGVTKQK